MSAYRVEVGELSLFDAETSLNLHYERDHDLNVNTKAARRGGTVAGIVLVELGIDGYTTHQARLDFGVVPDGGGGGDDIFRYDRAGDEVRALTDAIDALTTLRDRLEVVTTA